MSVKLIVYIFIFFNRKYEEIYPPDVSEFVYITDDTYTKKQVLKMEQLILKVLGFDVSNPTTVIFLTHICVHCNVPLKVMYLAMVSFNICTIYIILFLCNWIIIKINYLFLVFG